MTLSFQDRANFAKQKIAPILAEYRVDIGAGAGLTKDGRVSPQIVWIDKDKEEEKKEPEAPTPDSGTFDSLSPESPELPNTAPEPTVVTTEKTGA